MDGREGSLVDDGGGAPCTGNLVEDILPHFLVGEAGKVIMDCDPLAQGFMDGLSEGIIQMGFPTEYECKAVQGIIAVVHEHLDILQDTGGEVLCLVDGKEERLFLFPVEIEYLFLYSPEHAGFTAFWLYAQGRAELAVELHDADGGEAEIFHVVKIRVKAFRKAAQGKGLAHAGAGGKKPYAPCVFQVIQTGEHL